MLALPVGWDRERAARSAGVRTFPLVATATCGLVLVVAGVTGATPDAQSRVLQGLITGTGFLAAGVVLKQTDEDPGHGTGVVRGMTTAVCIWTIGVMRAAVGYGLYDIAFVLRIVTFGTRRILTPLKRAIDDRSATRNTEDARDTE